MRAAFPLALGALLLSGCFGAGTTSTTPSTEGPAPMHAFAFSATQVDATLDVSEPSILSDPAGTLWIAGPTGFAKTIVEKDPSSAEHDSALLKSTDHGATWTNVQQVPMYGRDACPGGGDSDLSSAPDGAVFLIDLNLANAPVDVSYDGGQTWLFNCHSSIQPGIDRQWIASTSDYVWVSVNGLTGSPIVYRADRHLVPGAEGAPADTSLIFGAPVTVQQGGAIVADQKTGTVYLAGSGATMEYSTDAGMTFKSVNTGLADDGVDLSGSFISIAIDLAGNVFVAGSGSEGIVVSGSADHGLTWTHAAKFKPYHTPAPKEKDSPYADAEYSFAWVAAGGNGTVGFAWYGWPSANETGAYKMPAAGYYVFAGQSTDILQKGEEATAVYARVSPTPITTKRLCTGISLPDFTQCDQAD
ncbi:MAG: hypothetical protein ABR586_04390, partial [Thermoplasmatota archaeon]